MSKDRYRVKDFLVDFDWAANDFYQNRGRGFEKFLHGASAHFHGRLIEIVRRRGVFPSRWIREEPYFIELLYAMLASWGMDSQKARLVDFANFEKAVSDLVNSNAFRAFEGVGIRAINSEWRERLRELWVLLSKECKIMMGESIIVGSSKLLHYLLPDAFAPIDRTYTLDFLNHLDPSESYRISTAQVMAPGFEVFEKAMLFFGEVGREVPNVEKYLGRGQMSGSVPKVIDNAVIAWWGTDS